MGAGVEIAAATTFDLKATTMFVDTTTLTLAGTTITVKDKANNKDYNLIKILSEQRRRLSEQRSRLDAIEETIKVNDDGNECLRDLIRHVKLFDKRIQTPITRNQIS